MTRKEWLAQVPQTLKADALWKLAVYRHALFLADIGWVDVTKLVGDRRTTKVAGQLYEAIGSIGANTAEGYSRSSGKDRARLYEYALGSAREARNWYYDGRHVLGKDVANHRIELLTEIIKFLTIMVPQQRLLPRLEPGAPPQNGRRTRP